MEIKNFKELKSIIEASEIIRNSKIRNAVFDLDNTLLIGDMGDAVFSMLKINGYSINLSWEKYSEILKEKGKEIAYPMVVTAMTGVSKNEIESITDTVIKFEKKYIEIEGVKVPVPRPHPIMLELLNFLKSENFNIYIISATNSITVKLTGKKLFGIPEKNCFGLEPKLLKNENGELVIGDKINRPLTISTGKAELYNNKISRIKPFITAGDSETDIHLLNLVDLSGISIRVGNNMRIYEKMKTQSIIPKSFYNIKRSKNY